MGKLGRRHAAGLRALFIMPSISMSWRSLRTPSVAWYLDFSSGPITSALKQGLSFHFARAFASFRTSLVM